MKEYAKLKFGDHQFRIVEDGNKTLIFNALRQRYIELTPEEWVRRNVVAFLVEQMLLPPASIAEEYAVELNGSHQRADIVVFNGVDPALLVECKESGIDLSNAAIRREVFAQAVRYNQVVGARFVMITNGLNTFIAQRTNDDYQAVDSIEHLRRFLPR